MSESTTSKEKILKKIRKALIQKSPHEVGDVNTDAAIFTASDESLEMQFAQQLINVNGKFVFCENKQEFLEAIIELSKTNNWQAVFCLEPLLKELLKTAHIPFSDNENELLDASVGITFCECLIARTGSVVISSKQLSGRRLPVYSDYHIIVAYTSQLVQHVKDALKFIKKKYNNLFPSMVTTITGPSRTADIEKTLVQGAHGPKEIFVFLIDDTAS